MPLPTRLLPPRLLVPLLSALLSAPLLARAQEPTPPPLLYDFQGITPSAFPDTYQLDRSSTLAGTMQGLAMDGKNVMKLTLDQHAAAQSIRIRPVTEYFAGESKRWYGFNFYIPSDWVVNDEKVTLARIDARGTTLAPLLQLVAQQSDLSLVLRANHDSLPANNTSQQRTMQAGTLTPGRWHCLIVSVDWNSAVQQGEMGVWLNEDTLKEPAYAATRTHNSYAGASYLPSIGLTSDGAGAARTLYANAVVSGSSKAYFELVRKYMTCPEGSPQ